MATANKIFIQIDNDTIELTGADKETFEADREQMREVTLLLETEYKAKQEARESAIKKLADIAGLTEDELKVVLNG